MYEWEGMILDRDGSRIADIHNIQASNIEVAVKRAFKQHRTTIKHYLTKDTEAYFRSESEYEGRKIVSEGYYGITINIFRTDTGRSIGGSFYVSPTMDFKGISYLRQNYIDG